MPLADLLARTPSATALGGTLRRHLDGWRWADGTPEPRVRDMALADVAPSWRCASYGSGTVVEIPRRWPDARYWPGARVDPEAARAIAALIAACGTPSAIYAERLAEALDEHRLTAARYIVPRGQYDAAMREPCGCWWDTSHEADILARARSLGFTG
jgi:hypothetical protein